MFFLFFIFSFIDPSTSLRMTVGVSLRMTVGVSLRMTVGRLNDDVGVNLVPIIDFRYETSVS